ncbi:rhomboid family intramembrane serine protease [Arthrobacter caoxuetaonis]|uniref:Rhomboid family intramembrane serine protease n=1 Tax=Arthrobacter caoxuetaonis TaxID=2886935 RepID=A0A9X1MDD5_9MICC|nr:rhomboid family intramembrane serine protease [Arthrobacter caoxuetaonis]MCC3297317.1 rhomboid family intramembrane serine protease [Arthrobacter caoxuetaonis]USQ58135.1 rhomboid family intramembrane serine protease [Arthrobacter caoxuetaonis]
MLARRAKSALLAAACFTALLWLAYFLTLPLQNSLLPELGILPRQLEGLDGILFAPLLHTGTGHLISNSLPLLAFAFLVLLEGLRRFAAVTAICWLASGIGVWLFGGGLTIGISGVVFGLFAYLIVRGFYNRSLPQILIAGVLFLVYGSILWGILPTAAGVSWQSHLFGAAGGVLAAIVLRTDPDRTQKRVRP